MCSWDSRPAAGKTVLIGGLIDFLFALMPYGPTTKNPGRHANNRSYAGCSEQRSDGKTSKRTDGRAAKQLTLPACLMGVAICVTIARYGGISRSWQLRIGCARNEQGKTKTARDYCNRPIRHSFYGHRFFSITNKRPR
jgi:hypothetical protein